MSISEASELIGVYNTESATLLVTFSAAEHCYCPLAGTHFPGTEDRRRTWSECPRLCDQCAYH